MLASGYFSLIVFITPFPTTWFGKQANGCTHTILGIPCSIYSIISAVKNQPSPVWFPIDKIFFTLSSNSQILHGNRYSFLELERAITESFSNISINLIAALNNLAFVLSVFIN